MDEIRALNKAIKKLKKKEITLCYMPLDENTIHIRVYFDAPLLLIMT